MKETNTYFYVSRDLRTFNDIYPSTVYQALYYALEVDAEQDPKVLC